MTSPHSDGLNVDELLAQLRARVAKRRQSGAYAPGMEEELDAHFRRIQAQRREPPPVIDLRSPLRTVEQSLPLESGRISFNSAFPGGRAVHQTMARLVGRQTQGVLEQAQEFASSVRTSLDAITTALEGLDGEVRNDVAQRLDSIFDQLALHERVAARWQVAHEQLSGRVDELTSRIGQLEAAAKRGEFQPWYQADRFEERFRGSHQEMLDRYRDVAEKLVDFGPVLDFGCGRGEFLELLAELDVASLGIEIDAELVKANIDRGLNVEQADGVRFLADLPDASLGGLALIQVVEHLSPQDVLEVVSAAANKLRPGGMALVETVNPQSLYVYAHAFYLDPTHLRPVHPAYLAFLFEEAGFSSVVTEWRSPPPAADVLSEIPMTRKSDGISNDNVGRLNQLLFAAQDYLLVAVR